MTKLLEFVAKVDVVGVKKFVAADNFKTDNETGIDFGLIDENFAKSFQNKVEENILAGALQVHKISERSLDASIITELGGNHESQLVRMWQLIVGQPDGQEGVLLVNGKANIFYIRDTDDILWHVIVLRGFGWELYKYPIGDSYGCPADSQVFGVNS